MPTSLFHLSFEKWGVFLFSIIPALINIGIFFYTSFFLPQNKTNRSFSVFVILLAISQIVDGLVHMSVTEETAYLWCKIWTPPMAFASPFGLLFALRFTGWYKKTHSSFLNLILFLPAIFLTLLMIANLDEYNIVKSLRWNWIVNPGPSVVTNIIYLWILGTALSILVILWLFYIKEKVNREKKTQALLLASGISIPFLIGIGAEILFPLVFGIDAIPLGTPSITIFSLTSLIAIKKYHLMDYSPKHQWDNIIEQMNEGIIIVDNSDKIMYANNAFCRLMEYEFSEIKGKIAHEIFIENPEHKKQIVEETELRKNKISSQYEVQLKTKSGKKIWMLMNGSSYLDSDGKVIGSIGILTNIQHLKDAESLVQKNSFKLKQAQSIAHLGSWELNFETGKAIWSDEACKIYGFLPEENVQSFQSWLSFIHPEDLDFVKKEIETAEASLSDSSMNHRIVWRDGTIKNIRSISKFEFDKNGKPYGLFGVCHDITESIKAEVKLKASNNELETYIYKASHDLKAPLASMLGLIQVSKLEIKDEDSIKYFNMLDSMAHKLNSTLSELIKSMVIKDTEKVNDEINFEELIQETLNKFQHIKEYSRIKIQTNISLSTPFLSSKFILNTIFQNLIENAFKYQNHNLQESFLKINISQKENKIKITFEDNGIGIQESLQLKIFEMYYRASEQSEGSGLGLYLVKKGVEKLNGEIQVSSILGKGTTFTILI